jgi:hypothetical protein
MNGLAVGITQLHREAREELFFMSLRALRFFAVKWSQLRNS